MDVDREDDGAEDDLDEDDSQLGLTAAGCPRKRRNPLTAPLQLHVREAYPGFMETNQARYQHLANLVASMRHFSAIRDDAGLAAVLATLLQAEVRPCFALLQHLNVFLVL